MSIPILREPVIQPDIFYDYDPSNQIPVIIDNGAYNCRAGYSNDVSPKLIFRNLIVKLRRKKEPELLVGNDITDLEAAKWLLRSAFEVNVVTQFDVQESVFDYIFSHLGINTTSVIHPIMINEPPAIPLWCRSNMQELLFECYGVPSLMTGIDALLSHYQNRDDLNCCIISIGHHSSHILPIVEGKLAINHSLRINLGGFNLTLYLQRILQLKYPNDSENFTFTKCEQIVQKYCRFAISYREESLLWSDKDYCEQNSIKLKIGPNESFEEGDQEIKRLRKPGCTETTIEIGSEIIRVPELLFSPEALIRFDQCGLSEALMYVIKSVNDTKCFENIYVTGGVSKIPRFRERVEADARSMLPFQCSLKVVAAENGSLDAWFGSVKASKQFSENFVTKEEYQEHGSHYIKPYRLSNW